MLRDFQVKLKDEIFAAWREPGVVNVLATAPTGSGKTVCVSAIVSEANAPACVIAHRMELVSQASLALNRDKVPHAIIAPKDIIRQIIGLHHSTHGQSQYNYRAPVRVASVDTLGSREARERWFSQVGLVVTDEAHHALVSNKWGAAHAMFPNARGLGVTAHAIRADGAGLGRHASGIVDRLVVGPSARELIRRGFITGSRILCPPSDVDFSDVPIGATGDYSMPKLRAATHKSNRLVGDVVKHYLRHAGGRTGLTFAVDIESAKEIAAAYSAAGVPAEVITAKTPIPVRGHLMKQFRERRILQLVSVDVLGEGTDVPAIEVVSLARRTASWQLYAQQTGRAFRVNVADDIAAQWGEFSDAQRLAHIAASGKPYGLILDHVGNVPFHGLPDDVKEYTLDNRESRSRRSKPETPPPRICTECTQPYERFLPACPYCGNVPMPAGRSTPEQVEGDLVELDPEALRALRAEVARIDGPVRMPASVTPPVRGAILRNHHERAAAQKTLREAMALYGGWREHLREPLRTAHKRFFYDFGVDYLSAQALNATDASDLEARIRAKLEQNSIVEATPS